MKTPLVCVLLAAFALPVQADPLPLKLHKKMRSEMHKKLGIDRDHRHRSHRHYRSHRVYHHHYDPWMYDYHDPYYHHGPSIVVHRSYVREPEVYREPVEQLTIEQRVQLALAEEGYYRGEIDGIIGPQTREAIRRYQHKERLPVTGRIDRELLDELDLI